MGMIQIAEVHRQVNDMYGHNKKLKSILLGLVKGKRLTDTILQQMIEMVHTYEMSEPVKVIRKSATKKQGILFVVVYEVIGWHGSGSYLVNARTAADAKKIVKAYDEDYARLRTIPVKQYAEEWLSDSVEEFLKGVKIPRLGQATFLESRT